MGKRSCVGSALTVLLFSAAFSFAQVATQITNLTGGLRTRLVWLEGGEYLWGGGILKGFDTQTGTVTTIKAAAYRQNRPILCTGGSRVVYTLNGSVYVINFDGTGNRLVTTGMASDVWVHPSTGVEWVIYRTGSQDVDGRYYRCQIDNPTSGVVLLCNRGGGFEQIAWWQVSADGTVGREGLPYPWSNLMRNAGLDLVEGTERVALRTLSGVLAEGCWSSCASDNSYYSFHFDAFSGPAHGKLYMFRDSVPVADVTINASPLPTGTLTTEFYHPKFASNGGRFLTLTGGYMSSSDYSKVEVYFGKFNTGYTGFDGWVRVMTNSVAEFMPDAWVGVGVSTPTINRNPGTLTFTAQAGGSNPASQNVAVTPSSGSLTNLAASDNVAWLTTSVTGSGASWNVANNVSVSGLSAGTYNATVTLTATGATSNTYTVNLTIGTPVGTSIVITPESANLAYNQSTQFSAVVRDQQGTPLATQPAITWTLGGGPGNATLSAAGAFISGSTQTTYRVIASSGSLRDTSIVTVYRGITMTYPTGGQVLAVGQTVNIRWSATSNVLGVVIMVSPNNGEDWYAVTQSTIMTTDPQWGNYPWVVPAVAEAGVPLVTSTVRLRIYSYTDPSIADVTPAAFTVPVAKRVAAGASIRPVHVEIRRTIDVRVALDERYRVSVYGANGVLLFDRENIGQSVVRFDGAKGFVCVKVSSGAREWVEYGVVTAR